MNVLGNELKIPVVTYGPGDSRLDHTPNEHIDIQEYSGQHRSFKENVNKVTRFRESRARK